MTPITPDNRDYNIIEVTNLGAGVLHSRNSTYTHKSKPYQSVVGGLVEPFAFGASQASSPTQGLAAGQGQGVVELKYSDALKNSLTDMKFLASAGGWDPGAHLASMNGPLPLLGGKTINYWSPIADNPAANAKKMLVSDGGAQQADNLMSFIQRGVKNIILFCNTPSPMKTSDMWNPRTDKLSAYDVDYDLPSFFGVLPDDRDAKSTAMYDISKSHVFPTEDWIPLAVKLQESFEAGNGIVVTTEHTTIRNDHFGVPAGLKVKVTWVVMARALEWERKLSDEMRSLLLPEDDPNDISKIRETGEFKGFPFFHTGISSSGGFNAKQANLLSSLVGWTIFNNADKFREALSES